MRKTLYIIILISFSRQLFEQTKEIVGTWVRLYDKTEKGKIVILEKNSIDTLDFYTNNKYLCRQDGSREKATWVFNKKDKILTLNNREFTMLFDGKYIIEKPGKSSYKIGKLTKDTLTILNFRETNPPTLYNTKYYVRTK